MDDNRIRPVVWLAVAGSLTALVVVLSYLEGGSRRAPQPQAKPPQEPAAAPAAPEASASRSRTSARTGPSGIAETEVEQPQYIEGLVYGELDLREARELMPDNLYWKQGSPTKDPEVLAEREAEKKRRNEEYGRVLAGDANEDEVRAYYDYKTRLSTDYLEFSEFMSRRYKNSSNEQFVGMLNLAMKMHAEKLAQLPSELEDALQRAREREKVREDWRRQQEEFGSAANPPDPNDEEEP